MAPMRIIFTVLCVASVLTSFIFHARVSLPQTPTTSAFRLPIGSGLTVTVSQGNNDTQHDHVGKAKWAFDFIVGQTNFIVTAAQGGTVIGADDSSTTGCDDVNCWTYANYVLIADDDGKTAALYLHLLHNSLKIKLGMHVSQGASLGLADTTGWATGPHLHFQVEDIPSIPAQPQQSPGWWWTQSVPVSFSNPEVLTQDADGVPKEGQSFLVSNSPVPAPSPITTPSIPVPVPTPTPPLSPTPSQTLLYSANWSNGLNGWISSPEWSVSNGQLHSDGSDEYYQGIAAGMNSIIAPYHPSATNYAVEANIQIINISSIYADYLGIWGRLQIDGSGLYHGYLVEIFGQPYITYVAPSDSASVSLGEGSQNYNAGAAWHTYRVEFRGNQITLKIDGKLIVQVTDTKSRLPNAGSVGLFNIACPINIRSFQVFAL